MALVLHSITKMELAIPAYQMSQAPLRSNPFSQKQGVAAWNVRTLHSLVTSRLVKDVAQYSCQPWVFLQCTCRSAQLCWLGNTPYSSERPDLVIYCTCLTLLPGICKRVLRCPAASLSHHIANIPGGSGKERSPKLLGWVLVICTALHIHLSSFHMWKFVTIHRRTKCKKPRKCILKKRCMTI